MKKLLKLDLGCGNNLQKDFVGVDIVGKPHTQATVVHDLFFDFPWPFEDNTVDEVFASHVIEHLPHGNGSSDPFFNFMDEVHRILKKGGIARFVCPYYANARAFQDPTHQRFITEPTFLYFTKKWRKMNRLEHYPVKCDFDIVKIDHAVSDAMNGKSQDAVTYQAMHMINIVNDIMVTLKKR